MLKKPNMPVKAIHSFDELISSFRTGTKSYLLLYKSGSETSECSLKSLQQAALKAENVNLMAADVNQVKDIHPRYQVISVPTLLIFDGTEFTNLVKGCNDPAFYLSLFEESLFHSKTQEGEKKQKRVVVYTTPSCSWCTTLKNYLKSNQIRYIEIDVSRNQQAAEDMVRKSGQQGVPQTDIEGEIIVGFDRNRINNILGIQQQSNN
jgi:glutaredoxin-like YruB-family protein